MRRPSVLAPLLALVALAGGLLPASAALAEEPPPGAAPPPGSGGTTTPSTPPSTQVTVPRGKPLYLEGQDGRLLVDGPWLFRADDGDEGVAQRWFAQTGVDGWGGTTAPSVWNAGGTTAASFEGTVGWYRKDFRLPRNTATDSWVMRFEGVNFRATVWLNGRQLAEHVGGYTPFEVALPNVARTGVSRLVVRVDNRRRMPEGVVSRPIPAVGWWNYGGLQREVYLRRVDRVDIGDVHVQAALPKPRGAATVTASATLRNAARTSQVVRVTGRFGTEPLDLGTQTLAPGASRTFTRRLLIRRPRLWSPSRPNLYTVRLVATAITPAEEARGRVQPTEAAGYTLRTGIRSLTVSKDGQLLLNGGAVHFRGVALHEDAETTGSALDNATRARLIALVRSAGATFVRSHYPLHPYFQELADRAGLLLWSEIPSTYQESEADLGNPEFRKQALQEIREDVLANRNHPSVAVWSVGNEMASRADVNQASYLRAGAALLKQLHPTGLVGLAFAGHPETDCQAAYEPIDVLGMNDYFGWYTGVSGNIADRDQLEPYLDFLRKCYPRKAIAVTEYGAEANRDGPAEEKGTYEFQRQFVADHLAAFSRKPWLVGSVYWALQEFRIRAGWGGGNPWATPPFHQKGLVRLDWSKKPAWDVLRASNRAARQYATPR
jgi:glycosyl hydrolase family 2